MQEFQASGWLKIMEPYHQGYTGQPFQSAPTYASTEHRAWFAPLQQEATASYEKFQYFALQEVKLFSIQDRRLQRLLQFRDPLLRTHSVPHGRIPWRISPAPYLHPVSPHRVPAARVIPIPL